MNKTNFLADSWYPILSTQSIITQKVVIEQWSKLIFETEIHQEVINLLKKMLKTEKIFRNPIYMAFEGRLKCLPVIRHSLLNYRNDFVANEKSKIQPFYELAKSNLNNEVIEYLMAYFTHCFFYKTKYTPQQFAIVIDENPKVLKLLKFYLEYVAANYQCEHLNFCGGYNFLYHIFNQLPTKLNPKYKCWPAGQSGEVMDSIQKNFKYCSGNGYWPLTKKLWEQKSIYCGIHSFLLSD